MDMHKLKYFMGMNGDTQADLAKALGLPQSALSARMNGHTAFRQDEINEIRKRYDLTADELQHIFFTT